MLSAQKAQRAGAILTTGFPLSLGGSVPGLEASHAPAAVGARRPLDDIPARRTRRAALAAGQGGAAVACLDLFYVWFAHRFSPSCGALPTPQRRIGFRVRFFIAGQFAPPRIAARFWPYGWSRFASKNA